jgi:hypothetical protein
MRLRRNIQDIFLYLELDDIEYTKIKAKSLQTNGICERVHQTILNEFYGVVFRKKIYLGTLRPCKSIWLSIWMGTILAAPIRGNGAKGGL